MYIHHVSEALGLAPESAKEQAAQDIILYSIMCDTQEQAEEWANESYLAFGSQVVETVWPLIQESHELALGA